MGKRNPVERANILSRLFFWWTIRLFYKGTKGDLSMDDIYDPLKSDESERITDRLEKEWKKELEKLKNLEYKVDGDGKKKENSPRPSLARAIVRLFWLPYFISGLFALLQCTVLRTLQPILQSQVIRFFEPGPNAIGRSEAIIYASGLVITTLTVVFILHHMNLFVQRIGMRIRVACSSLVYRKSLKLSQSALNQTAAGQVINLLSNDVNRFDYLPLFLNFIWIMPIQLVVVGCIMWRSIGVSTLVGIGSLLIFSFPMVGWFSILGGRLRGVIARLSDRRVQLMSELISGIQVVKTYAWEKPFDKIVSQIRISEINKIKLSSYLRGLYLSVMVFTERTCLFLTIMTFVLLGNPLTAGISFQLASYFNILQLVTAIFFPQALILLGEAMVSIRRLEEFLLLDDISTDEFEREKKIEYSEIIRDIDDGKIEGQMSAVFVELNRLSANWVVGQLPPTLCEVSLKIEGGKLCSLIGPVGAGKSSLLHVLLRELPIGAGTVALHQMNNGKFLGTKSKRGYISDNPNLKISYASQDAWLFTGTVRENILFGQPYDQSRYQQVTTVCSLVRDFKQLPYGDMTIVGDRGTSLSGGQRARVNLARAIYREADIYLLDDPLSAVDARVAHRLFKDCIIGHLKGKTRILVTHQLHFLQQSDNIVVLERGFVKHQGTYDHLTSTSGDFNDMLNRMKEEDEEEHGPIEEHSDENLTENVLNEIDGLKRDGIINRRSRKRSSAKSFSRKSSIRSIDSYYFAKDDENEMAAAEAKSRNQAETIASGKLSLNVYGRYFRMGGGMFILSLLIFNFAIAQIATSGGDYWLRYWTNVEAIRNAIHDSTGHSQVSSSEYLSEVNNTFFKYFGLLDNDGLLPSSWAIYFYAGCILACILLTISRCMLFMFICMRASRKLHNEMFSNILNATMLFFNTNPLGRILNRFSKDVGSMDELLPKLMLEAFQITLVVVGVLSMVVIVNYVMIIPIVVIGIIFYNVRTVFLNTAQDIKRLEGNAKSPVFSHVDATLNGLTTIRSRGENIQMMLRKEFDQFQDKHSGTWYLLLATASAFGLLLDVISCFFVACVCFSFIFMEPESTSGGSVGLAISQSLILTGMLQYGVRQTADVQSQMTAIERILQYTDLPKEGPMQSKNPPPPTWPAFGRVQFKKVFMTYKVGDPPVLKDLNIIIEPGWKVGVVGRTGAGKSSLISALFRLTGEGLQGEIIIDGRDTSTIGLQDLRSSISIIPQEPVLFSQTLRYNLDPFGKYPDSTLWDALREVELADYSLDHKVTEGGSNFSVGQRQLICLARAILRNNKILVLDEATANIDTRTDALIQRTIRLKFDNCTVITIAHRLNTIIDSDRVLVMDDGRMVEFDTPYELLFGKPDSQFANMVAQTGEAMAKELLQQASSAYRKRRISVSDSTQRTTNLNDAAILENISL